MVKIAWSKILRVQSPKSDPFSLGVSAALASIGLVAAAAILTFYFFFAGFTDQCDFIQSLSFNPNVCAPASLLMGSSYYTRPDLFDETAALSSDQTNTSIGMFPWSAGGFGNGDTTAPINCGQQSLNYTSETFECQLSFTYILLRVDSGSWITQTCFYCGGRLRTACTLIDSQTTGVAGPLDAFQRLNANYDSISGSIGANSAAILGSSETNILSLTIRNYTAVPGLAPGILTAPFDADSVSMNVGTPIGAFPISEDSSNASIRSLALAARNATIFAQNLARSDLNGRRFLVGYSCRDCKRVMRGPWPLLAVLASGLGAVWPPFFVILVMVFGVIYPPPEAPDTPVRNSQIDAAMAHQNKPYWDSNTPVGTLPYQQTYQQVPQQPRQPSYYGA